MRRRAQFDGRIDCVLQARLQSVPHDTDPQPEGLAFDRDQAGRLAEAHDGRDVLGSTASFSLLAPAAQHGRQRHARTHHERSRALGATELVSGDTDQSGTPHHRWQVQPGGGLHRVAVHEGLRGVTIHHVGYRIDISHHSGLGVGSHD